MKRIKVAVTGAGGQIGYALLFRIANGDAFGKDVEIDLNLLEIEPALPALKGLEMELEDGAFPLLKSVSSTSDPNKAFKDVNWAILVGSVPRKEGMERKELLGINGGIFKEQGKAINDNAASDVRVFVVGNPCNTNCLVAQKNAPDIPTDRFFAMTTLDHLRAQNQLAKKAGVAVNDVKKVSIWGNHSNTQYPDFYNAEIKGEAADKVIHDKEWLEGDFIKTIQERGAAVIKARGSSSAASAANAVVSALYNLTHDTAEGDWFSTALVSSGQYGVEDGLVYSYPVRVEGGTLGVVERVEHNEFAKEKLEATEKELKEERDEVKKAGLI